MEVPRYCKWIKCDLVVADFSADELSRLMKGYDFGELSFVNRPELKHAGSVTGHRITGKVSRIQADFSVFERFINTAFPAVTGQTAVRVDARSMLRGPEDHTTFGR